MTCHTLSEVKTHRGGGGEANPIFICGFCSAASPYFCLLRAVLFLAGINPFRRVTRRRVPLIDLIEERSSFHEICTNRERRPQHYSEIWFSAALFAELLHRNLTSILQSDRSAAVHFALSSGRQGQRDLGRCLRK